MTKSTASQMRKEGAGACRPLPIPTGKHCPKCGGVLLKRFTAHGVFIACVHYPQCSPGTYGTRRPVTLTRKG
jgi:hypothetical protein